MAAWMYYVERGQRQRIPYSRSLLPRAPLICTFHREKPQENRRADESVTIWRH
uniref:Uncharacterized protein n=1 Tax=Arundo donax TaxID=35708 RepID=A0A0A9EIB3_ARUDO